MSLNWTESAFLWIFVITMCIYRVLYLRFLSNKLTANVWVSAYACVWVCSVLCLLSILPKNHFEHMEANAVFRCRLLSFYDWVEQILSCAVFICVYHSSVHTLMHDTCTHTNRFSWLFFAIAHFVAVVVGGGGGND